MLCLQGVINQFEITPYSSDNIKHYCGAMELQERPLCDGTNEGLLWYNYTANVLYKCEKSVWTILKNDRQSADSNECKRKIIQNVPVIHYSNLQVLRS